MVRQARSPQLSSSLGPWGGSRPQTPELAVPSISQGSGKVSRARKGSKVVKAKAPEPTVNELTSQVSLLKKQLGEVQLEAVRCHDLELSTSTLQQEVASLREELARSEERGREERKEHCAAQVEQLLQLVLVRAELQEAETQASGERAANCHAREEMRLLTLAHAEAHHEAAAHLAAAEALQARLQTAGQGALVRVGVGGP